ARRRRGDHGIRLRRMPLYFAYGSNIDAAAMQQRCPRSRPLGPARVARHSIFIRAEGYASIRRDPSFDVHGVLYDLALSDVPALDRYEAVGRGLYSKLTQPILRAGAAAQRALVYVGASQQEGRAAPDYLNGIVAAAKAWEL